MCVCSLWILNSWFAFVKCFNAIYYSENRWNCRVYFCLIRSIKCKQTRAHISKMLSCLCVATNKTMKLVHHIEALDVVKWIRLIYSYIKWCLCPIYIAPNERFKWWPLICFIELAQRLNWTADCAERPTTSTSLPISRSLVHSFFRRNNNFFLLRGADSNANCNSNDRVNWENCCGAQLNSIKLNLFIVSLILREFLFTHSSVLSWLYRHRFILCHFEYVLLLRRSLRYDLYWFLSTKMIFGLNFSIWINHLEHDVMQRC